MTAKKEQTPPTAPVTFADIIARRRSVTVDVPQWGPVELRYNPNLVSEAVVSRINTTGYPYAELLPVLDTQLNLPASSSDSTPIVLTADVIGQIEARAVALFGAAIIADYFPDVDAPAPDLADVPIDVPHADAPMGE